MGTVLTAYSWARLQPGPGLCGPAALRHALLCHGRRVSVARIARLAKTSPEGTDEAGLGTAALVLGFQLQHVCRDTGPLARVALHGRAPALVCVDRWDHWVAVVYTSAREVVYLDSERPGPVERADTWLDFLRRAMWWHPKESRWDFYPVVRK